MIELYKALIKFNGLENKIDRSKKAHQYKYAPLEIVKEAVDKNLRDCGLGVMQLPIGCEGHIGVKTILFHESGEKLETEYSAELIKKDPQTIGSYITYLRRYAYLSVLNLQPENEDDDAQQVKKDHEKKISEQKEHHALFDRIINEISRLSNKFSEKEKVSDLLDVCGVKSSSEIKNLSLDKKKKAYIELSEMK